MRDFQETLTLMEKEEDLIAVAQLIVKALESKKYFTDDARKILASLGSQLCEMSRLREIEDEGFDEDESLNEIEHQFNSIQGRIMNWEKERSMLWNFGVNEAYEYLKDVDDVRKLIEVLEGKNLSNSSEDMTLLCRAHDVLQTAMARLEEEFKHLLIQNRQPFEPAYLSFCSTEDDMLEAGSIISSGDDSVDDIVQRESMSRASEDYIIELVPPHVVQCLKSIAHLMYDAKYGHECSQTFITAQKDALDDYLFILDIEKFSIEDVLKMEWNELNSKIRKWIRAMKIFVRVYLTSEKLLTDQIFGEIESVSYACFADSSKSCILQLLNFGEAIAIGPHQPEKLMRILDMYEVLGDLIPVIVALYSEEFASYVMTECQDVLTRLGECARATFVEFENVVASDVSVNSFPGGGVHHLTRYVLNYMSTLMDYSKTLDVVLNNHEQDDQASPPRDISYVSEVENNDSVSSNKSPLAEHFQSLVSVLECNIDERSMLYKDESQQHFFLMNNIHYMAEKIKNSELRTVVGDEWIRKRNGRFQHHAMNYQRATWSSILALLKDEGIQNPGSNSVSRTILKDRMQRFYLGFEEVYKNQTSWLIRDGQLRDELRISTSLKVIQAYRAFVGRHINHISEKHIKYTADDLEGYLLHLFEGSQKSLHSIRKKFS